MPEKNKKKSLEEKLKESEEKFKILFENAPDGYFISDLKGNFIDGNRAAEKIIGYNKGELIGKNMLRLRLVPINQIPLIAKRLTEHSLGKDPSPGEFTLFTKEGGTVRVEISGTVVKTGGKTLVLGIVRDISDRKRKEEELKKKSLELEKFHNMAVGREKRIIELKNKIKELEERLNNK